jgi:hypothetical protein
MQTHRLLSGVTILLMVVLVAAGWFLVAQPQLAAAATANGQLGSTQAQIASTQAAINQLKAQQKDLPKLQLKLAALRKSIPEGAESSAFIDGINALAASSNVTVTSVTMADAVPYTPPVTAAAPTTETGTATPSPAPSATETAAPAPVAPTGWSPPSDPTITPANFVAIPVSITTTGDWTSTLGFLHGLQSGKRLFLISGFTTATDDAGIITATTDGYIYALLDPKADALRAAYDKAHPTATPTPTVAPTPTPTVSTPPNPSGSSTPTPTTSPTP